MIASRLLPGAAALALALAAGGAAADPAFQLSGIAQATFARAVPVKPPRYAAIAGYSLSGTADDTSDTGIHYGATVRVGSGDYGQSDDSPGHNEKVGLNEAFLFAETAWGRFRLGDDDGAADRATDLLPTLVGGEMSGDWLDAIRTPAPAGYLGRDSDDATKLLYQTPRLLGLQLGVSYAPQRHSLGEDIVTPSGGLHERNLVEVALNERGDAGPLSYELGVAYSRGQSKVAGVAGTKAVSAAGLLIYGGFSLGAVWFDNADSAQPRHTGQTGGATVQGTYQNGPYGLTLFWHQSQVRDDFTMRAYGIGAEWDLLPEHFKIGVDLIRTEARRPAPNPDEAGHVLSVTLRTLF
jgi:hypothetical protein